MSKFILVHDAENDASPIIINTDLIMIVSESKILTGTSDIILNAEDNDSMENYFVTVTETREQIFEMLK